MATYIQGVTDFLPQVQPWEPDFNMFMGAMEKKQQQYDAGWQKTNSIYNSYLNAPMLRDDNISKRNHYFNQIANDIQRLSQLDLSLPQNVTAAQEVFEPIINDDYIINDIAWTQKYQKEMQAANYYRNCTDPKKCGGKYWDTGVKALNYMAQDFRQASADDALQMRTPEYIPYSNALDNVYEQIKNSGFGKVKRKRISPDGKHVITETNGGQEYLQSLMGYLTQTVGNNPDVGRMYWAKAYTQRKDWITQYGGNFETPEVAEAEYYKSLVQPAVYGLTEVQAQVGNDLRDKEVILNQYEKLVEKEGIVPGSAEHKRYAEVHQEVADLFGIKENVDAAVNNVTNTSNNNSTTARQYNSDSAVANALMYGDLLNTAVTYQGLTYEFDFEAEPYALAAYKSALDRSNKEYQMQLNIDEYLAKRVIDWEGQLKGFGGGSSSGKGSGLGSTNLSVDEAIKQYGSYSAYLESLMKNSMPEQEPGVTDVTPEQLMSTISPTSILTQGASAAVNQMTGGLLGTPASQSQIVQSLTTTGPNVSPDTYQINVDKEKALKNDLVGTKATVVAGLLNEMVNKEDPEFDVEYDAIFGNMPQYNPVQEYMSGKRFGTTSFINRSRETLYNPGNLIPTTRGEAKMKGNWTPDKVLDLPAESIDFLYSKVAERTDPRIGDNVKKGYMASFLNNYYTPTLDAVLQLDESFNLMKAANQKRWEGVKDKFGTQAKLGIGELMGLYDTWKVSLIDRGANGERRTPGEFNEDEALVGFITNVFTPGIADDIVARTSPQNPQGAAASIVDALSSSPVLTMLNTMVNPVAGSTLGAGVNTTNEDAQKADDIVSNAWKTFIDIAVDEFTDSQGKKVPYEIWANRVMNKVNEVGQELNPRAFKDGNVRGGMYGYDNALKNLYYGWGEDAERRGKGAGLDDYHYMTWSSQVSPYNSEPFLGGSGAYTAGRTVVYKDVDPTLPESPNWMDTKTVFLDVIGNQDAVKLTIGDYNRENLLNAPEGINGIPTEDENARRIMNVVEDYYDYFYSNPHKGADRPKFTMRVAQHGDQQYMVGNLKLDRKYVEKMSGTKDAPSLTGTGDGKPDYATWVDQGINFFIPMNRAQNNIKAKSQADPLDQIVRYNGRYDKFRAMYPGTANFDVIYNENTESWGFEGKIAVVDNGVEKELDVMDIPAFRSIEMSGANTTFSAIKEHLNSVLYAHHLNTQRARAAVKAQKGIKDKNQLLGEPTR